jgi:hypothetical protein
MITTPSVRKGFNKKSRMGGLCMLLSQVQKKTIHSLSIGESYTIGGVAVGQEKRYEIHRMSDQAFNITVYALMNRLDTDQLSSPEEVIQYIEHM